MTSTQSGQIVVTVKTLDGINKEFSPHEDITVQAFKELITESVGVPVGLQRLIFRGRVLQDDKTLAEYNLAGNTIHLVQRLAGTSNTNLQQDSREHSVSNSPHEDGDSGNAIIMGTIGHLDIPQGNQTPRRNSAAVRLQVANEMINRASNLLLRLEEEEEEVLAVQLAVAAERPVLPNIPTNGIVNGTRTAVTPGTAPNNIMSQIANAASAAAMVATVSHVPSDNNNSFAVASRQNGPTTPQVPPEAPRIRELATSLQDILALQERLTPFLRLVLNVLRENRQYSSSEAPQFIYDTVSAAIHAVSHSLHALSDITVDFAVAPDARRLRAPASILVEQSTVVRATIPIPMQAGMQMQLPANLQNIVNAAANASFAQGMHGGSVEFRQMQAPTQAPSALPVTPSPTATTTPTNPVLESNSPIVVPVSGAAGPTIPLLQFPGHPQNAHIRQHIGSPTQMQLPDFLFGPGGLLSSGEMGQNRGEIYDLLLSCHSHHIGAQRQPRPENLNEHLEDTNANANSNGFSATNHLEVFLQTLSTMELFHSGIKDFVTGYLLRGRDPRNESHVNTWAKGIAKKFTEWILKTSGTKLERNQEVDLDATLSNIISQSLTRFISLVIVSESSSSFRVSTIRLLEETAHKVLVAIKATFALHLAAKFLRELIDSILVGSSLTLRRELTYSVVQYMETSVGNTGDFIKGKSQPQPEPPVLVLVTPKETKPIQENIQTANASIQTVTDIDVDNDDDELDRDLVPPLLRNIPQSWVDTIRHDITAQRHAPSQPPFSHGFRTLFPPK